MTPSDIRKLADILVELEVPLGKRGVESGNEVAEVLRALADVYEELLVVMDQRHYCGVSPMNGKRSPNIKDLLARLEAIK